MSESYTTDIALCFVIDAVNDDNNALALFMLLISNKPTYYNRLACLFMNIRYGRTLEFRFKILLEFHTRLLKAMAVYGIIPLFPVVTVPVNPQSQTAQAWSISF